MTGDLTPALPKSIHCVSEVYCDLLTLAGSLELHTPSWRSSPIPNQVGRGGASNVEGSSLVHILWTGQFSFLRKANVCELQSQSPNKNGCVTCLKFPPLEVFLSPANMSTIYTSTYSYPGVEHPFVR